MTFTQCSGDVKECSLNCFFAIFLDICPSNCLIPEDGHENIPSTQALRQGSGDLQETANKVPSFPEPVGALPSIVEGSSQLL